jgi:ribosomal protein S1
MRFLLAVFLLLLPALTQADMTEGPKPDAVVKGDVLYWEGEDLVVKEISGREARLHVNAETKIEGVAGRLKAGDKIEAKVTSEGHALSISLQLLDSGASSIPPSSR